MQLCLSSRELKKLRSEFSKLSFVTFERLQTASYSSDTIVSRYICCSAGSLSEIPIQEHANRRALFVEAPLWKKGEGWEGSFVQLLFGWKFSDEGSRCMNRKLRFAMCRSSAVLQFNLNCSMQKVPFTQAAWKSSSIWGISNGHHPSKHWSI